MSNRKPYPGDVSDEEWTFVAPYATLACEDFPKSTQDLRAVTGALRWIAADVFEAMVYDLRFLLRLSSTHTPDPSAVISGIRTPLFARKRTPRRLRWCQAQEGAVAPGLCRSEEPTVVWD